MQLTAIKLRRVGERLFNEADPFIFCVLFSTYSLIRFPTHDISYILFVGTCELGNRSFVVFDPGDGGRNWMKDVFIP